MRLIRTVNRDFRPILSIKVTITIDTVSELNGPNFGDGLNTGTCEQGFTVLE